MFVAFTEDSNFPRISLYEFYKNFWYLYELLQVKLLLESCREGVDENEGSFYYKIPSRKSKPKEVQVIPWSIDDSNYSVKTFPKLDPLKTVFCGALHGMMNAEGLFRVMDDLFGGVLYAGKSPWDLDNCIQKKLESCRWEVLCTTFKMKTFVFGLGLDSVPHICRFVWKIRTFVSHEPNVQNIFSSVPYSNRTNLILGIDTDKKKYPIGSGRVTFDNYKSFVKAVTAAFVDVKTPKFNKKVCILYSSKPTTPAATRIKTSINTNPLLV